MLVLFDQMDGSMASGIDNEKATTDVDDSRWEAFDISSSEDEYEVPSSDDDDSIFGDLVSESDNMDIDDEDIISGTDDEPTSENTSDVVVIRNSELTYYGNSDLEDFAYGEDVPEQSKSLEGGVSQLSKYECKSEVTGSSQMDHTKQEDNKDPYHIDAEMSRQRKYEAAKAMIFLSEEAAYYFYNKYAKEHGFSIRREKKKERLDELGTPTMSVSYNRKRKIKAHQKSRIMSLGAAGMRLFNIMRTFISDTGKYSRVRFVRKDLYNMSCREKRKMIAKGDANTTIGIIEKRKRDDPEFYFDYKLGKGGKLLHLFWRDSQSRQDYADFGDVLVFDSTYKTNRYAMPFIPFVGINNHRQTTIFACAIVSDEKEVTYKWLLETFLKAMYQQKPKGIITDGDAAMIADVGKVFPGVWYRVCTWHIEKNMKKHIDPLAHNEFRSLLYYTTSEQVFEGRWRAFVEKHQTELTKEWMKRMYRRKKLWSAAYLANGYFLGMKSNQRSESLNSTLHTHLDFGLTMVDMVVHYENNSSRVREEEARQDTIDSQTVPVAVTTYKDIEMSAARKFTATNFYLVQGELKKIGGLEIWSIDLKAKRKQ
nr:protein FAR1-RELATED SEQUENCE 5-like [Lolium perenne]